jgi:hypothetical protein
MSNAGAKPADDGGSGFSPRKTYQPPRVVQISLRPEEAVLGHCKTTRSAGPISFSCSNLGACKTIGS